MSEKISNIRNDRNPSVASRLSSLRRQTQKLSSKRKVAVVVRNVLLVVVLAGLVMLLSPLKIFGLAVFIGLTLPVLEADNLAKRFKDHREIRMDRISQLENEISKIG